jgi:ElaB/YqjD/DUF883 family membrane-anchored ribosome-binding protein
MNAPTQMKRTSGDGGAPSTRELIEQSERVREDVVALAGAVRQAARGWRSLLRDRLDRQPYATLAVAAGVGYVLGGGMPTLLVRSLIGMGGRLALEQAIARFALSESPEQR